MRKTALVLLSLSVVVLEAPLAALSTPQPGASNGAAGPRYDVTSSAFGAVGDGFTDDTAAIQAAFAACGNTFNNPPLNTQQNSGVVEFPGSRNYIVTRTINTYNCQIEGSTGNIQGSYSPPRIWWKGPPAGAVAKITGFAVASNKVTFTAENNLTAGQFVEIEGLTSGFFLNRAILQVSSAGLSGTEFQATLPFGGHDITRTADFGIATTVNVVFAIPSNARYQQAISNISIANANRTSPPATPYQVGFYFGSRVDTGTRIANTWVAGATMYSYYFSAGGININFDQGWRSDGAGVSGIYWRVSGADSLGIANGTVDNDQHGRSPTGGAAVMMDNANCVPQSGIHFTSRNIKIEINTSLTSGLGAFTMYDCPRTPSMEAFWLDFENTWVAPASGTAAGFNFPSFFMSPPNDAALHLSILNGGFPSGSGVNKTTRWVGIPQLLRNDIYGFAGRISLLSYAPSTNSDGGYAGFRAPISLIGDVDISQLWQYGIHASDFLYSDTAFTVLPNGTTLFAGQILAPPAYWSGASGKRYAIGVVYKTGTTGTPNGGLTTCSGASIRRVLTCNSARDLSAGQRIAIGTDENKTINYVDATDPTAVLVNLTSNLAASHSNQPLSFSAPVLGPEIQMPTKSSSAPSSLAWSQGDMEQNSAAQANGVAAWVNVSPGAPGYWAGIPLGDDKGKIAASQLASARTAQAFCAGTATSSSTLLLFGAGTAQTACTESPGPQTLQQILLTTGGTLSKLAVRCGHLGSQPSSGRFSVWDLPSGTAMSDASSGTDTGLTVTIGNSLANANKTFIDTEHTFAYAAGDMIRIQFTTQADETLGDCSASLNY